MHQSTRWIPSCTHAAHERPFSLLAQPKLASAPHNCRLENEGVERSRLFVFGHGKSLSASAAVLEHSTHPNAAPARSGYGWAEIFIDLDGVELPARPDYYGRGARSDNRVPRWRRLFGGAGSDEEEESDADEDGEVQGGMLDDTAAQPQAVTLTATRNLFGTSRCVIS